MQQKNFRLAKFQVVQRKSRVVTYMSHVEVFMSRIKLNHMINALLESRSRDQGNLRTANIKNQEQRSSDQVSKTLSLITNASTGDMKVATPCNSWNK